MAEVNFILTRRPRKKGPAQAKIVRREVVDRIQVVGKEAVELRTDYVEDWANKPEFSFATTVTNKLIALYCFITNKDDSLVMGKYGTKYGGTIGMLWDVINEGTGSRTIEPRPDNDKGLLYFRAGPYTAKTKITDPPSSGPGAPRAGAHVSVTSVEWPGFDGRHQSQLFNEMKEKRFNRVIDYAYRVGFEKMAKESQ